MKFWFVKGMVGNILVPTDVIPPLVKALGHLSAPPLGWPPFYLANIQGPYGVHFKLRDCPYGVQIKHRECPYGVQIKRRDIPYI